MTIGEPMQFFGEIEDENLVRAVTARLMETIHELAEESERRVRLIPSGIQAPAI